MPRLPRFDLNKALTGANRLKEAMAQLKNALPDLPAPDLRGAKDFLRDVGDQVGGGLEDLVGRAPPVPPGARYESRLHAGATGRLTYKLFLPSGYRGKPVPLIVMLHGCSQSPDDFARGTRMNDLAEEQTFVVAYPGQSRAANISKCWNWFKEAQQKRGQGEPSLIAGIAREIIAAHAIDPKRVYVAGLSAGGAAAAILGATYPDLFRGIGVHSGLACGAARDLPSGLAAMKSGAPAGRRSAAVPTIVFHGDDDRTVHPANGDHIIAQSKGDARSRLEGGVSSGGMRYTRIVYAGESNRAAHEHWVLHGAGHAWSGGSASGSFTDPRGPDASREMMRFFRELQP